MKNLSPLFVCSRCFYATSKRKEVERYLERQASDQYSRRAKTHSYRARSAFKLLQINERFHFIKPGMVALDVGAAPGSWCQVLAELIFPQTPETSLEIMAKPITNGNQKILANQTSNRNGYVLGVDLLGISPIENVDLLCRADITKQATQAEIRRRLNGRRVDLLVSDMAPNPIGDSLTDHVRILRLCRTLLDFGTSAAGPEEQPTPVMANGGIFLCKIFDGPYRAELEDELKSRFRTVRVVKPDASRDSSSEQYLFATHFNGTAAGRIAKANDTQRIAP